RMAISRRRLLEWETASDVQQRARNSLGRFFSSMLMAPLLSLGAGAILMKFRPEVNLPVRPLLALWIISPAVAWFISQPLTRREVILTAHQRQLLRILARRTWRFFETFVGAEDHHLPPDNYQEFPREITA